MLILRLIFAIRCIIINSYKEPTAVRNLFTFTAHSHDKDECNSIK